MAALRVILARRASNDLDDIWTYVAAEAGARVASDLIDEILAAMDRLAEMPGMGHTRPDVSSPHRVWSVFRFLIIYRFDSQALYVARVVHGQRDLRRI